MERRSYIVCTEVFLGQPVGSHAYSSGETAVTAGLDIGGYEQRPDWPKMGASHLAGRVLSTLVLRHESIFPSKKEPWFVACDENVPK